MFHKNASLDKTMYLRLFSLALVFSISACSSHSDTLKTSNSYFDDRQNQLCLKILQRYPFNKDSDESISIKEFDDFFSPSKNNIKKNIDSNGYYFSIVKEIQNYFYSNDYNSAKRQVSIKTKQSSEGYQYISLKFNGNTGPQITGPKLLYNMEFPQEGASISLATKLNGGEETERFYSGPWAFLRFLDESEIIESSQDSMTISTPLSTEDTNHSIKYTVNHLSQWESIRNAFFCPE